jgi:antitoxin component YwqK of YwqJK toxin-antitoxin module
MKIYSLSLLIFLVFACNTNKKSRKINLSPSGVILSLGDSINNVREGEWIISSKNSKNDYDTSEIRYYKKGELNGLCKIRIPGYNNAWEYLNWENNLKNGPSYQIFENGDSLFNGMWKNGKKIGKHTSYHFKGRVEIQFRENRNNSELDLGMFKYVELDHRIACQANYNNQGILNGKYISFDEKGRLNGYGFYLNGEKKGVWLEVREINTIDRQISIGNYNSGKKEGFWFTYNQQFYNSILEYEDNDSFFLEIKNKIKKQDYLNEITYKSGEIIKSNYFIDGNVFHSEEEVFDYLFSNSARKGPTRLTKKNTFTY